MPHPEASLADQWLGTLPTLGSLLGIAEPQDVLAKAEVDAKERDFIFTFKVGEFVEYDSASAGAWIAAKVLAHKADGSYDLDCKPGVSAAKIRAATFAPPEHEVGAFVEYFSDSKGGWIPAVVKVYNGMAGTYDLDCKPNVLPSKIRLPTARNHTRVPSPDLRRPLSAVLEESGADAESMDELNPFASSTLEEHDSKPMISFGPREEKGGASSSTSQPSSLLHPEQENPLQLVRVSRSGSSWRFEVNEDAASVLEACGQRRISVCTVCGPYRTGKSYLLNLLLGRVQRGCSQFRVGSTTRACTEGLWMWGFGDMPGAESTSLLFLDCEGFGSTDSDKTRDAKLMSLCMLLSSVFLLNTKGVLSESLFNALSLVCHMAEHIDEKGQEASKPALVWLLRDFLLELADEEGRPITPDEYLEQCLRKRPPDGADAERSRAAREVREMLLRYFPHRSCTTLCQPVIDEEQLRHLSDVPFADLRAEFRGSFQELQSRLVRTARAQPKTVAGQPVTAAAFCALLRKLVDSLNRGSALNIGSAWAQVQHTACEALASELQERAALEMQKVRQGGPLPLPGGRPLPVSDQELAAAMKECRRLLREEWRARAVGEEAVKAEYWKELKSLLSDNEKSLQQLNVELADTQLSEAGLDWEGWISQGTPALPTDIRSEGLLELLNGGLPSKALAKAAREALSAARLARLRCDGSLEAAKAQLKLANDELASKAAVAAAATRLEGEQLQQNREVAQLQGQVEALQTQAREAIERERALREKARVLSAEEAARKEQRMQTEAGRQRQEAEQGMQALQAQVAELRAEVSRLGEKQDPPTELAPKRGKQPKCGCSVM